MDHEEPISFGAVPSIDDPRTISSASVAMATAMVAETQAAGKVPLDYEHVDDLCSQKSLGICTMCGVRIAAEHHFHDGVRLDEYWGYLIGKTLYDDPLFGHFEGSSAFTMLKAANKVGIPEQEFCKQFPLKTDGSYEEFIQSFQNGYHGEIPQAILDNAAKHKIAGYARVFPDAFSGGAPSQSGMMTNILAGRVLVGRFAVGKNLYRDKNGKSTRKAKDLLPLRAPEPVESGHIMDINEFWKSGKEFGGPNSWSRTWCPDNKKQEPGYYWFEFKTQIPYFTEAWVILDREDKYIFMKDLTVGSTGPDVVALQKFLVKKELMTMPPGVSYGYFGNITRDAVARYQKLHGIKPTAGYFGPITRKHINENQ